jgi:deoxycytidine triphosphate deaminase
MILSINELRKAVAANEIGISPSLEENQWGEASINLRLSFEFTKLRQLPDVTLRLASGLGTIGAMKAWDTMVLKESGEHGNTQRYPLGPGQFILAQTYETISAERFNDFDTPGFEV